MLKVRECSILAVLMWIANPVRAEPPGFAPVGAAPVTTPDHEVAPEHDYPTEHRPPVDAPCALGHICLGPVVTFGVPNLVGIGAHMRVGGFVGFGADFQYLPTFGIESIPVNASSITLEGRLYPTGDSFFVGAGFVYQSVTAEGQLLAEHPDGGQVTLEGDGELGLPLLKLGVGFLGHTGPVIGIDLAIEIPLASRRLDIRIAGSAGSDAFDAEIATLRRDVQEQADNVLDILPLVIQLNFLRLGYIF